MSEDPIQIPEVVYHYTSIDTALKILDGSPLWATSVQYFNDTSEREHFITLVRRRLEEMAQGEDGEQWRRFHDALSPSHEERFTFVNYPFATCFSEAGNSLSQWMLYGATGNGVSLGFSTDSLERAKLPADVEEGLGVASLGPSTVCGMIRYVAEGHAYIQEAIDDYAAQAPTTQVSLKTKYESDITLEDIFAAGIREAACFVKHPSFSGEREYRLLLTNLFLSEAECIRYRAAPSAIPYLPVSVDAPKSIREIIVGPSPHAQLTIASLQALLRSKGLSSVKVMGSGIPFRRF